MFCKTLTDSNHPSRQAELACMVLHFLSEDLTQFDVTQGQDSQEGSLFRTLGRSHTACLVAFKCSCHRSEGPAHPLPSFPPLVPQPLSPMPLSSRSPGEQKRQFLAALTASAGEVFPFLCRMLEQSFGAASGCRDKGDAAGAHAHMGGGCLIP